MRTLVLVAVMMLGIPAVGTAAPCVPDSLAAYILLGSGGCAIGSATVNDFSIDVFDPLATPIDGADILVTPSAIAGGFRLDFGLDQEAAAGEFFDAVVGYSVTAPSLGSARLTMTDSAVEPDGVVTGVEELCLGDVFLVDPTTCFFGTPAGPLIVIDIGIDQELAAEMAFGPASFFDVFTEIAIDGGSAGVARLGTISNEFTTAATVPEPSSLLLVGGALLGFARRYRRAAARPRGGH
jgi:hypothetical protein